MLYLKFSPKVPKVVELALVVIYCSRYIYIFFCDVYTILLC